MRTRLLSYSDYGISDETRIFLEDTLRNVSTTDIAILAKACKESNYVIWTSLLYSIISGLSYEKITINNNIPLGKGDFYGYRRKAIALFKKYKE